ncbi:Flavin-dependent oxidoreductase, luciferase family (includes alkanesulfonate monooxygenase SsuD and methylene tetrahydromethanopterin reductase) [Streptosporangium subroseum]|uniref:Flavin-dependent oxidoreductase, luciferase family (Includes alkanesulfonate monooxygenase SsuD and methylene tetrahydromethanopterin reductase) n=1 Tax=Streptosporangium subroseum TaxID=106412 RepID=A0A239L3C0_9ACTN|nr:LLM class flavin-dependent oxidoreductase [Streptosporangium subroseum]SNT25086.1 Flavin-dependent oxidoreductase, luciferase family (includes alkanesulfonate monooxygenase SsuD and methylene tetrahydromethanopterin reductase) [Streptosporangium subroseum]
MTTFSVLLPFMPTRPEHVLPVAALVQHSAATRLWQGQSLILEPHQTFTYAAASGFRVPVGTGVTLMPFRHPLEAALQARSLAVTTGHPVVAGFGPGAAVLQKSVLGAPYASPLTAVREYLTIVGGLLAGQAVEHEGEYFSCRINMGWQPGPRVELGLGVLRPAMARLAGELADVAITWLTPAGYLRDVIVPALREGARAAGRPVPRLAAIVPVALSAPDRDPADLVLAANSGHLSMPHYQDMLRRSGIEVDPGNLAVTAKGVVASNAFVSGDPGELRAALREYRTAGVDEIVLNITGVCQLYGLPVALAELETILREVTA